MSRRSGRLLLVRHGESEGNRERRFSMNPDISLTELGEDQARATGEAIAKIASPVSIVASSFFRARRTAELIAEQVRYGGGIEVEPELRERAIGELAGQPYSSVRDHPGFDSGRFWEWRPAGGESLEDVQRRAAPVLQRLMRRHPGEDVVVVSHGGVMLALCAHVEGGWTRGRVAQNCEVVIVEHDGGSSIRVAPLPEAARHVVIPGAAHSVSASTGQVESLADAIGRPAVQWKGAEPRPTSPDSSSDETEGTG